MQKRNARPLRIPTKARRAALILRPTFSRTGLRGRIIFDQLATGLQQVLAWGLENESNDFAKRAVGVLLAFELSHVARKIVA